jgi:hypothetical protein
MRERVVSAGTILDRTQRPSDNEVIPPLLFYAPGIHKKLVLGFCDVDGERWGIFGEAGRMRYLWTSQGLICILDPLQIRKIRDKLGNDLPEDAPRDNECTDQTIPLANLLTALRQRATPKYGIPIAVVVSKGDAIRDLDPELRELLWDRPLYHQHNDTLSYDLALHWQVHFAVRNFLNKYEPGLTKSIEENFLHFSYFCVAPTGCSARGNRIAKFAPWRVEEPILWILAKLGLIPIV